MLSFLYGEAGDMTFDCPADADGDAIRRVVANGSDLSIPMKIEFFVAGWGTFGNG